MICSENKFDTGFDDNDISVEDSDDCTSTANFLVENSTSALAIRSLEGFSFFSTSIEDTVVLIFGTASKLRIGTLAAAVRLLDIVQFSSLAIKLRTFKAAIFASDTARDMCKSPLRDLLFSLRSISLYLLMNILCLCVRQCIKCRANKS